MDLFVKKIFSYERLFLTVNQLQQLKVLTYFDMILLAKIRDERQKIERKSFMVCMVVVREKIKYFGCFSETHRLLCFMIKVSIFVL